MCVKSLSDGELPKVEKRNLAVHELRLAATEDSELNKKLSPIVCEKKKEVIFYAKK